jgi:aryl-alcohol dehydrogenase-like predicted oxidoreductase
MIDELVAIGEACGVSAVQISLAWLIARNPVASCDRRPAQFEETSPRRIYAHR